MVNIGAPFRLFVLLTFILTLSAVAQAQATRTWVSGVGDDVNPCSRTAPCKTYAGAISKTAVHGEISTLDPGGYGIVASSGARMSVSHSVISNNVNHAIGVEGPGGASEMHVTNSHISNNGTGISQSAGGTVRLANCDVVFNTANGTSGTVLSYGNNRFAGNGGSSAVTAVGVMSNDFGQQ